MEKGRSNIVPIVLAVIITTVVVAGAMHFWYKQKTYTPTVGSGTNTSYCTQSGGTLKNGTCTCPKDDTLENAQCITADGSPDGELGQEYRRALEVKLKANQ